MIEIVKKFIKAYNSFDIEGMLVLLDPDIHFVNMSGGEVDSETHGKAEFEALARMSAKLFKERRQQITSFAESDDVVKAEIRFTAVLSAGMSEGIKNDQKIDLTGKSEYKIKDNLILSILDIS